LNTLLLSAGHQAVIVAAFIAFHLEHTVDFSRIYL